MVRPGQVRHTQLQPASGCEARDPRLLTCRPGLATCLRTGVALVLAASVSAVIAHAGQNPALYSQARSQLAASDTAAALSSLRELTKDERDFAAGWGLLGRVLTARATGVATDLHMRQEADRALRRALRLDPDNPLYLFALGQLMRKQQIYLDSRRLLNCAIEMMEDRPEGIPPADQAELWYQRGLFYEDEFLDTQHLVYAPNLPVQSINCDAAGTFCVNFAHPRQFNEHFRHAADLSSYGEDDSKRMVHAFRRALEADPTHSSSFRRLVVHLIDQANYAEALSLARRFLQSAPESPWAYITLGLIYQRTGRDSLAEVAFDRGLALAPPEIAAHYRDVSPILKEAQAESYRSANDAVRRQLEEILWRKSDPLYLTAENEVRVAHLARVAYADLMFEDPSDGVWGSDTERGLIYVRYGPPQRIWQLHRDAGRELSLLDVIEAEAIMAGGGPTRHTSGHGGGRWIFWNYGWDLPNFIFQKQLRWRHASHLLGSYSKLAEEVVRKALPAVYTTDFEIHGYAVQLARFRGAADSVVELDLYSEVPADRLLATPEELDVGVFVFAGVEHVRIYERTLQIAASPEPQAVTYSLPLLGGRYTFSVEARAASGKSAVRREEVELQPFLDAELSLSDLVLANTVTPRVEKPADRRGFALNVNRRLEFEPDDPLAIYWEVYGLATDDEGFSHYRVTISVTDAGGGGILATVAGAVGDLLGLSDGNEPELSYDRVVELSGDRVPEYMTLELAENDPGEYRVRVQVTDQLSGKTVVGERVFQVIGS